uniref:Golgin subfamily A conserved domain-containing protein n=1 Tax=Macaca fascicularis TaxID=9541 RepID=A0A7N9CXX3_MACFA
MDLPKEKADRKEQVERLELGFIQLSGATEGMRDYISEYESQGAVPNTRHQEKEDVMGLAQNEEMKVKLLELQKLVLPLVCNHEGHDKFPSAAQNRGDEPAPGAPAPQELGAAEEQGDLCEVSLAHSVEPAAGEAREGSPRGNPTTEKIVQLLPVMQDTQEHPGLASKPCVPFFYRAAENREINIVII